MLFRSGTGALIGITVGGRTADTRPVPTLYAGFGGLVAVSVVLALTAESPVPVAVLVFLLGFAGFATNPTLNRTGHAAGQPRPPAPGSESASSRAKGPARDVPRAGPFGSGHPQASARNPQRARLRACSATVQMRCWPR